MERFRLRFNPVTAVGLLLLVVMLGACSTDSSPTAPSSTSTSPPPGGVPPSTVWNLTVTASPDEITINGTTQVESIITVVARRADNNQPPPDGTTVILTSSRLGFPVTGGDREFAVVLPLRGGTNSARLVLDGNLDGAVVVQAQLEDSFGQTTIDLVFPPPPPPPEIPPPFFIEGIEPNFGSPAGGSRVRIFGSGFDTPVRVLFGDRAAEVLSVSNSLIRVATPGITLPVGDTLTVAVTVTINLNDTDPDDDEQSDSLPNAFTYTRGGGGEGGALIPQIISLTPRQGPNEGGTRVVITGEGFADEVQVFFGSPGALVEATIEEISDNRLVVRTPSATGFNSVNQNTIVDVQVVNLDSGLSDILMDAFQYGDANGSGIFISATSPGSGPWQGGTRVTFLGSGFDDPVAVTIGSIAAADIISVTGTEIIAVSDRIDVSSCGDVTGETSVVNINTAELAEGPPFTYRVPALSLISLSPRQGFADVANQVQITANNLDEPLRVTLTVELENGGQAETTDLTADIISVSGNTLTVSIPPAEIGTRTLPFGDCTTPGGLAGRQRLSTTGDLTVLNPVTTCEDTLSSAFTLVPRDSSCVPAPPTASFTATPGTTDTLRVQFVADRDNADTFTWNFGDGTGGSGQTTSHLYASGGDYFVTLTVSNSAGTDSVGQLVSVQDPPPPPPPPPPAPVN